MTRPDFEEKAAAQQPQLTDAMPNEFEWLQPSLLAEVTRALPIGLKTSQQKDKEHCRKESCGVLRELTSWEQLAREDERKSIARELHDELGQQLTALRMGVSTSRLLFGPNNPALAERLQHMLSITDQAMQALRNVVTSLRPSVLDAGIIAALEWLVEKFARDSGISCCLHVRQADIELDEMRGVALFRIVQEALTNVARHAAAQEVEVELEQVGDQCRLEVRDDGKGFDPGVVRSKSFGLLGLKERVAILGGEITFHSARGNGTIIRVKMPIHSFGTERALPSERNSQAESNKSSRAE